MSKSVKARKADKVKVKPRKSYINEVVEEEADRVILSVLKQKANLKDFEEFLEEEIFIYESNLHLLILDYCKEHNIPAVNVYDGFYFIKGTITQSQYQKLYDQMTLQLKTLK